MTNAEFCHVQDVILQLSNKALSDALKVSPTSVSLWRGKRPVPDYIHAHLEHLQAQKVQDLTVTFTLPELTAISRRAYAAGLPLDQYLMQLIRKDIQRHQPTPFPTEETHPLTSARVAEDPSQPNQPAPTPLETPPSPK